MADWYDDIAAGTATDTNATVTFTDTASGLVFRATEVTVRNLDTSNELFVEFTGPVATTGSRRLNAGDTVTFVVPSNTNQGIQNMGLICSTGETAVYQVWAVRPKDIPGF
jgi:hypothetical protein